MNDFEKAADQKAPVTLDFRQDLYDDLIKVGMSGSLDDGEDNAPRVCIYAVNALKKNPDNEFLYEMLSRSLFTVYLSAKRCAALLKGTDTPDPEQKLKKISDLRDYNLVQQAQNVAETGLKRFPNSQTLHHELFVTLDYQGRYGEALTCLKKMEALCPKNVSHFDLKENIREIEDRLLTMALVEPTP